MMHGIPISMQEREYYDGSRVIRAVIEVPGLNHVQFFWTQGTQVIAFGNQFGFAGTWNINDDREFSAVEMSMLLGSLVTNPEKLSYTLLLCDEFVRTSLGAN
jgi:hypothetical protein